MRRIGCALLLVLAACQAAERPARAVLLDVPFERGGWATTERTRPALDALAAALLDRRLAGDAFIVRAAVPPEGDDEAALTLSRLRAASVVDALVARGVPRARLSYDGLGADPGGARIEVIAR
jgi:outer membrane protein OmpA-like peptidoglycan-associated protein